MTPAFVPASELYDVETGEERPHPALQESDR